MPNLKPNKILIVHGWEADSSSNWFPQAKDFFAHKGFQVFVPDCPGNYFPKLEDWLAIIKQYRPDASWILIGHSLGGVALMRYLETAPQPVAQTILTATPIHEMQFTPLKNFFKDGFDFAKIRHNGGKINLIFEEEDEVVPLEHGKILAEKFRAPLEIIPGAIHLCRLKPEILEEMINES